MALCCLFFLGLPSIILYGWGMRANFLKAEGLFKC